MTNGGGSDRRPPDELTVPTKTANHPAPYYLFGGDNTH